MRALAAMGLAQVERSLAAAARPGSPPSAREALLEAPRQRNAFLDFLFYDLNTLSEEETRRLAPRLAAEGAILCVGPSARQALDMWSDYDSFAGSGSDPDVIVVAGVGSSALGAAAFARNVADAVGGPVFAVVSGYGLADLAAEALGGFFLFGALNDIRDRFGYLDDVALSRSRTTARLAELTGSNGVVEKLEQIARRSLDVATLVKMLSRPPAPRLLVGHSKGNLILSEALHAVKKLQPAVFGRIAERTRVITVSARIAMPAPMRDVVDVMGALDTFGELNSRSTIATDVRVPMAWHHTNTGLPFHLPVTATLSRICSTRALGGD